MINDLMVTLTIRRIDVCNLKLACLAAKELANDKGEKWDRLHDELTAQLDEFNNSLNEKIESIKKMLLADGINYALVTKMSDTELMQANSFCDHEEYNRYMLYLAHKYDI